MRVGAGSPFLGRSTPLSPLALLSVVGVLAAAAAGVKAGSAGPATTATVVAGLMIAGWMFFTERTEVALAVVVLYLGLLDGFLKLRTGSTVVTLGRDVLLYAIVLGMLARAVLRGDSLRLPPLSGWVIAFVAFVVIQVANPASLGITHTLGALRPHLEFVPLFFIGYLALRTAHRLRMFFALMLIIAAGNGVVGLVQLNLTPSQLAAWGPGYSARINGTGTGVNAVSGRTYLTAGGQSRTRPFGLGSDAGVGGEWGMLAIGGALALASLGIHRRFGRLGIVLCAGPPLAVIVGEGRSVVAASLVVVIAYTAFATSTRRLVPTFATIALAIGVIAVVVAYVGSTSGNGVFDRYRTITPSHASATTGADRGGSIAKVPRFIVDFPLGNGLGSVGPASEFAGGGNAGSDGETEPGFLLSELGIPGLIVVLGLNVHLLALGIRRIRRLDADTRPLVAALLAGLVGILVIWISSTTTATTPFAPYLWLTAGALSWWLARPPGARVGI